MFPLPRGDFRVWKGWRKSPESSSCALEGKDSDEASEVSDFDEDSSVGSPTEEPE